MESRMQIIEPTIDESPYSSEQKSTRKRIVAAYCRVSTPEEEQMNSYENQMEEFAEQIKQNPNYTLYKVYGDGGITGTSAEKRKQFLKMIRDAENGKFDLILCKSISRFARNTILTLSTIEKLKNIGVEVFFDKEKMSTFDPKNDFMFTIMSSMAQEESRQISGNVLWAFRILMEKGNAFGAPFGYKMRKINGKRKLVIAEEQAKIVKLIFDLYDKGISYDNIINHLHKNGIKTPKGRDIWCDRTIKGILNNETYTGVLTLQKTYTVSYLGHVRKPNNGQRRMYRIENAHQAIISKEQWERVNAAISANFLQRAGKNFSDLTKYITRYSLSGLLICRKCGLYYKRRKWSAGFKIPKNMYQCIGYTNKKPGCERCHSQGISENIILTTLADMINRIFASEDEKFSFLRDGVMKAYRLKPVDAEIERAEALKESIELRMKQLLVQKLKQDDLTFIADSEAEYDMMYERYKNVKREISSLKNKRQMGQIVDNALQPIVNVLNGHMVKPEELLHFPLHAFVEIINVIDKTNVIILINISKEFGRSYWKKEVNNIKMNQSILSNTIEIKDPVRKQKMKYHVVVV